MVSGAHVKRSSLDGGAETRRHNRAGDGGSRGLGAAAARRLAQEGADVAITYLHAKDVAEAVAGDLKSLGVRAAAFQAGRAKPGQHIRPLGAPSLDEISRRWAVNVQGLVATTREAAKNMPDGERIINLGSVTGEGSAAAGLGDHAATRAAVSPDDVAAVIVFLAGPV
ncbi:hypothetical protein [Streptomyces sp. NPDC049040]|uniref:hypothetical protein n=1 Tax=Streptomyces sp. NPDC049040 TaxID=3365593 RepID=UPI00371C9285